MPETLHELLQRSKADNWLFADTLAFIERHYRYQPQAFTNGPLHNAAGENQGSCKILGLALLEGLSVMQALLLFGEHYRQVLASPGEAGHANIRQLIRGGLAAVSFQERPLHRRSHQPLDTH